jgi:peptidase C25-like protein
MPEALLVAGRAEALDQLEPLIDAHRSFRPVRTLASDSDGIDSLRSAELTDVAGVLFVGPSRRSPSRMLPGLFLRDASGRFVPIGWVPNVRGRLEVFAQAAARVVRRAGANLERGPLALLGQWDDRTLRLTELTMRNFLDSPQALPVFRWTSERIVREDMLRALGSGIGVAMYFGHGRARGWAGYGGVRAHDLAAAIGEPVGAVLSLTCRVASRHNVGLSFAEEMVLHGFCAAALAATSKTAHLANGLLANRLCQTVAKSGVANLAEWLLVAELTEAQAQSAYRIIGDPLAALLGAANSLGQAKGVFAPAPDDPLPPFPEVEL